MRCSFLASLAFESQEPVSENAALEVFPELFFHEFWKRIASLGLDPGEESLQIFGDDLVKRAFLRAMALVGELFCRGGLRLHSTWDCKSPTRLESPLLSAGQREIR